MLRGWRLGVAGAEALAAHADLSLVTQLDLEGARIGDEGLVRLLASPFLRLRQVDDLNLADNALTAVGLRALGAAPFGPRLKQLYLGQNGSLDGEAIEAVAAILPGLEELHLERTAIGDAGAIALARTGAQPEHLRLGLCGISEVGVAALVNAGTFNKAASIGLGGDPLGDAGAAALVSLQGEPGMLDLSYTGLGEAGLKSLLASGLFGRCGHVSLIGNPLGAEAYRLLLAFEGRLPGCVELPHVDDVALARALRERTRVVVPGTPLAAGLVLACPYCREVIGVEDHLCGHCKADATNDAGSEERPARLAAEPRMPCPHCGASMNHAAIRCPACASWTS